jgi:hypothetical protein
MSTFKQKVEATRFIMRQAKEQEAACLKAEAEIKVLKAQILGDGREGKILNGKSFARMIRVQWLDTERSKSIRDVNELWDLVLELWSEEDFVPDVDYKEKAKQIMDKPASRLVPATRTSYKEMKIRLENIVAQVS